MRYFYFLVAAVMLSGFFGWINFDYAGEITVINKPAVILPAGHAPRFSILQKIQEGMDLLRKSPPLIFETKNKKPTSELVRKQIAFALLDTESGDIFEQRVWVREQDIKNYKKTGVITLEPCVTCYIAPINNDKKININVKWWNSFNTFYEIPDHPKLIVVANKYLFPSKYLASLPEKSKSQYTDIVYAPYSKRLHIVETIETGKIYLEKNIDQAFAELETDKVTSRFLPGTLVTKNISKDLVRNIIVVEHVDPDSFSSATDGGQELSERVLAVIGANQELAYRYTGSPAGASGLAQFIKSTYDNMVSRYPKAKLIKNYNSGMANHINAIKAMVLFFDSHRKEIADKTTRQDVIKSFGITEEMLAATYNGGPGRVIKSVNKYGLAWLSRQLDFPQTTKIFRLETLNYLKKFQAIKNLNLFADIGNSL
ncbi:MAG: hypothetical protein HYT61_02350 [Candidatus Yanofskybacteria bacterium]|nr:hypothetical protein [Candidatus Yanofskybacteria bacterium]